MKKAAPQNKQSSPTRLQTTFNHYISAIHEALEVGVYGVFLLTLIGLIMELLP